MTEREIAALKCAQHIIKIKRTHSDYRDSWVGGESNLATEYMLLRQRVQAAEAALADARRENDAMAAVVEAAERYVDATKQDSFALTDSFRALQRVHDTVRAYRARAKEGA